MPPRPSSPFSRSVTNRTAQSIARRRMAGGKNGSAARTTPSRYLKNRPQAERYGPANPVADLRGPGAEQFLHVHAAPVAGARAQRHQHHQRHDHRARPVRHLVQVERKPVRQQHDFDRHARHGVPGHLAVQRQLRAGEHVGPFRPAGGQDGLPRPRHVRRVGGIADHLQREIGFHAGREVEGAIVEQRPAAMRALDRAQIHGDLALQVRVHAVEEMLQQHVFGRDGGVGLELEHPVPVRLLPAQQSVARAVDSVRKLARRCGASRISLGKATAPSSVRRRPGSQRRRRSRS